MTDTDNHLHDVPGLNLKINPQPDETTCGPTCLQAIYHYFGLEISLQKIIKETESFKEGGTLDVFLANHALHNGFQATLFTYNMVVFDPTWFTRPSIDLKHCLREQQKYKSNDEKLKLATAGYLEYLELGGKLYFEDLSANLLRRFLKRGMPILTGLSATYLYRSPREWGPDCEYDDIRGEPSGHFVVLAGYEKESRQVVVADPLAENPISEKQYYRVSLERVIGAILLGVLTYDANLLILYPKRN